MTDQQSSRNRYRVGRTVGVDSASFEYHNQSQPWEEDTVSFPCTVAEAVYDSYLEKYYVELSEPYLGEGNRYNIPRAYHVNMIHSDLSLLSICDRLINTQSEFLLGRSPWMKVLTLDDVARWYKGVGPERVRHLIRGRNVHVEGYGCIPIMSLISRRTDKKRGISSFNLKKYVILHRSFMTIKQMCHGVKELFGVEVSEDNLFRAKKKVCNIGLTRRVFL